MAGTLPPCNKELQLVSTNLIYSLRNRLGERLVGVGISPVGWVSVNISADNFCINLMQNKA